MKLLTNYCFLVYFICFTCCASNIKQIKITPIKVAQEQAYIKLIININNLSNAHDELVAIETNPKLQVTILNQGTDQGVTKKFNLHKIALPKHYQVQMNDNFYIKIEDTGLLKEFILNFHFLNHQEQSFKISLLPNVTMEEL
ncbi:hypothetical protein [Rickettsiales endosymbiont of Stachyamoeba lipophora]|uniref:hypothetical protein n=1 Tax=Rickettsiales endosymbiont of Stachyamoeba lipophora TaxID=2486578 RepID=UPI000F64FD0D|nr:hypothetical protein [Rickettsiales endosymbiont of Stachyamoeba lipophora]AZL15657.1 hypothetical protein EF513_03720 [Rickettsiales endosymbiont of Stachyamoeba lipophora]